MNGTTRTVTGTTAMNTKVRYITVTAMLSAVAFVLMYLEIAIPIMPAFIKFDFSDLPALLGSFAMGPMCGVLICLIKNVLHLAFSNSMFVGELSNFILGAVFVGVAGIFYRHKKTRKSAFLGAAVGALAMALISIVTNYFVVYPAYTVLYSMPMDAIIGMYKAILPASDTLLKSLVIFNLPFTFAKGMIDTAVCFAVYKRISPILKKSA